MKTMIALTLAIVSNATLANIVVPLQVVDGKRHGCKRRESHDF